MPDNGHVFLKNTVDNTMELVSTYFDSDQPLALSDQPYVSGDGRVLVFRDLNNPTNFLGAPEEWYPGDNIFWVNLSTGERQWVNKPTVSVMEPTDPDARVSAISADGRYVLFDAAPYSFIEGKQSFTNNVWLYDTQNKNLSLVSQKLDGDPVGDISGAFQLSAYGHAVSDDGRFVVFSTGSPDIVENETNNHEDIFIRDMHQGITLRISEQPNGGNANGASMAASISPDGRNIFFSSTATNLIEGQAEGSFSSYVASNPFLFNGRIDSENSLNSYNKCKAY